MREQVLREVASNRPEVIEKLWQSKKMSKAKREELEAIIRQLPEKDREELIMGLLSKSSQVTGG